MPTGAMHSGSSESHSAWILSETLRPAFQQRYGPVYAGSEVESELRKLTLFATCGDMVTAQAVAIGHLPLVGVVDLKTQRNDPIDPHAFDPLAARRRQRVWNPAGMISDDLRVAVREIVGRGGGLLEVDGEEDLAVMPLIETLPVGSTVLYGIPGEGVCFLSVDGAAKRRVDALFHQMEHRSIPGA
ncbi:MAG: DUF359 domain-containing protein [Thermoplasmata archaeon]